MDLNELFHPNLDKPLDWHEILPDCPECQKALFPSIWYFRCETCDYVLNYLLPVEKLPYW